MHISPVTQIVLSPEYNVRAQWWLCSAFLRVLMSGRMCCHGANLCLKQWGWNIYRAVHFSKILSIWFLYACVLVFDFCIDFCINQGASVSYVFGLITLFVFIYFYEEFSTFSLQFLQSDYTVLILLMPMKFKGVAYGVSMHSCTYNTPP